MLGDHRGGTMKAAPRVVCFAVALLALAFVLGGCGKQPREAVGAYDTPEHHYEIGVRALDDGNLDAAMREFTVALELDDEFGPALAGKGLVMAMQATDEDQHEDGIDLIDDGKSNADNDAQKVEAYKAYIRAYIAGFDKGYIDGDDLISDAELAFKRGKRLAENDLSLNYFLGMAYMEVLDFDQAAEQFAIVKSDATGRYYQRADASWELLQKAQRAAPGSLIGKRIALVEQLTRADMAALLVEELNVKRFYEKTQKYEGTSEFKAPKGIMDMPEAEEKKALANDIAEHPMRTDIEEVLVYGVQGLDNNPDGSFTPNMPLSKAEVALIFQDVIVRATGDEKLATQFIGQRTPFPDVRSDHFYFNAVMLSTTRGLMEGDQRTGLFKPGSTVTGVDALLYVKELKTNLNPF